MSLKKSAASGIKWTAFAHYVRRGLSLLTNLILARLLAPTDFGLMAMAAVLVGFAELFRDVGMSSAVVQRREVSQELLSSIFWVNVGLGLFVTTLLFMIAPFAAGFYHEPRVTGILRAISVSFFISALGIVQGALLSRALAFKQGATLDVVVGLLASAVGVGSALSGSGVWSLVYQILTNTLLVTVGAWYLSRWRPSLTFRWTEVKSVLDYGLNLTGANICNYFVRNADNMLIGRYLGAQDLGYYDLAYKLMLYPLQNVSAVVNRVMFPLYARMQDDLVRYRHTYLKIVGAIGLLTFPLMFGLFAVSDLFVRTVVGEQWAPLIVLLMIFAPLGAIQSISTTVGGIFMATGRTGVLLVLSLVEGVVMVAAFFIGLQWGLFGVAISYSVVTLLMFYPDFAISFRLIGLKVSALRTVLARPLLCSLIMCGAVYAAKLALSPTVPQAAALVGLVLFGALAYGFASWTLDRAHALEVLRVMRGNE